MKIVSQKRTVPMYGFSLKLYDDEMTIANFPLVNFPLFPINRIDSFLKIFTAINYFFSKNIFQKFWQLLKIIKNVLVVTPNFFHLSFLLQILKFIKKRRQFILSFDYHSIGAYRLGNHIVKLKLVPNAVSSQDESERIDWSIENYIRNNAYELELMVQYCYDLDMQSVNKLNRMWKNSDFVSIGKIKISQLLDKDDSLIEKMSFNPFDNIPDLRPVGRIQNLRDAAYRSSFSERRDN